MGRAASLIDAARQARAASEVDGAGRLLAKTGMATARPRGWADIEHQKTAAELPAVFLRP